VETALQTRLGQLVKEQRQLQRELAQELLHRYSPITDKLKEAQIITRQTFLSRIDTVLGDYVCWPLRACPKAANHQSVWFCFLFVAQIKLRTPERHAVIELQSQMLARFKENVVQAQTQLSGGTRDRRVQELQQELANVSADVEREVMMDDTAFVKSLRDSLEAADKAAQNTTLLERKKEDKTLTEFKDMFAQTAAASNALGD